MDTARQAAVPALVAAWVQQLVNLAIANFGGDHDYAGVITAVLRLAGVEEPGD